MAEPLVATFSIAACDLGAQQWGVAVQSKFLAVGSIVPWAEAQVGAVATQAFANARYGPEGQFVSTPSTVPMFRSKGEEAKSFCYDASL